MGCWLLKVYSAKANPLNQPFEPQLAPFPKQKRPYVTYVTGKKPCKLSTENGAPSQLPFTCHEGVIWAIPNIQSSSVTDLPVGWEVGMQ